MEKWDFFKNLKNWHFYKNLNKIFSFKNFFTKFFFTKYERNVDMKNVQKHDFCSKIDQIMSMSNKPKKTTGKMLTLWSKNFVGLSAVLNLIFKENYQIWKVIFYVNWKEFCTHRKGFFHLHTYQTHCSLKKERKSKWCLH